MKDISARSANAPMQPRQRDLTQGPIGRTLLAFAVPTLASSVLQSLNGSVNAIWIGRFLGEDALAAATNGNIVMFLLVAFVFGFGMAATIIIGQAFGRRDLTLARRTVGTAVGAGVVAATIMAVLGWFVSPWLLGLMGTPGSVAPLALAYLRMIFVAMPPMMVTTIIMMALRGGGDALTPMWFMALTVVIDIALNPLLIAGIGPFPALGIAGSALATVIAGYVGLMAMLFFIYARDLPLRLRGPELRYLVPARDLIPVIVRKGVPIGLQMIVISSSALAMLGLVNREGVMTVAAYGVAQQLWTYVQMPAMALGAAVSAMAAQNIGAGRWERVSRITGRGVVYNLAMTGALVALLTLFDRPALALFLGTDSPAIPIGQHIHLLATWSFIMFGVTLVLFGTVRANGEVVGPLIILFIGMYPVRLGLAVAAYPRFGADALWLSFPAGSLFIVCAAWLLYRYGKWRSTDLVPPDEDELREEAMAACEPGGAISPSG